MKNIQLIAIILILIILLNENTGALGKKDPSIILSKPDNGTIDYYGIANFTYTPTDNFEILWCRLILNESIERTDGDVTNASSNHFTDVKIQNGTWVWRIECEDNQTNLVKSSNRTLIIKNDTKEPIVELFITNSTANGSGYATFRYKPIDYGTGIGNCKLIVDGKVEKVDKSIMNNTENVFGGILLPMGSHTWGVNCTDLNGNEGSSGNSIIEVDLVPKVIPISPDNNTKHMGIFVDFAYKPISPIKLSWCNLVLNGKVNETSQNVVNNTINYFNRVRLSNGTWAWYVNCTDKNLKQGSSDRMNLSIYSTFLVSVPMNIQLISPKDNVINTEGVLNFTYNTTKTAEISKCELITNNSTRAVIKKVRAGRVNTFPDVEISNGLWVWKVRCTDNYGDSQTSKTRILRVSKAYKNTKSAIVEQPIDTKELNEKYPSEFKSSVRFIMILIFAAVFSSLITLLANKDIREKIRVLIVGDIEEEKQTELEKYIDTLFNNGYSETQIVAQLKRYNWGDKHINKAIGKVKKLRRKQEKFNNRKRK